MTLSTHLLVAAILLSSFTFSETLFAGNINALAHLHEATWIQFANGQIGTLAIKDDGVRVARFPDGSHRRENANMRGGSFLITARMLREKVLVPSEPKMSATAVACLEKSKRDDSGKPAKERLTKEKREQLALRHFNEGKAKSFCMSQNAQYDRYNNDVKSASHDFERPLEARKRYGQACVMMSA